MPLLHCMGVDHYGHSFTIALCFLDRETQKNYDLVLQWLIETVYTREGAIAWPSVVVTDCEVALTNVIHLRFPATSTKRILCRWHIMMNIRSRHKASFLTEERWKEFKMAVNTIISAKTFDDYLDAVQDLENEFHYREDHLSPGPDHTAAVSIEVRQAESSAVSYVLGQWFGPHKEYIVSAWVDRFFNCGSTTTSRVEGGHRQLKSWIGSSTNGLDSVVSVCRVGIGSQLNEISIKVEAKLSSTPLSLTTSLYSHCIGFVSQNALYKLREQHDHVQHEAEHIQSGSVSTICTGIFTASYGILCWHKLKIRLQNRTGKYFVYNFTSVTSQLTHNKL